MKKPNRVPRLVFSDIAKVENDSSSQQTETGFVKRSVIDLEIARMAARDQ